MNPSVDTPIRFLKGIGPKKERSFNKIGIRTIDDLLFYFPRRYEDRTRFTSISQAQEGLTSTIKGVVMARGEKSSWKNRRFSITEVAVEDGTGQISCVWFNQKFIKDYFEVGTSVILFGRIERYQGRLQMNSPEFEVVEPGLEGDRSLNIGRIVPVYSLAQGSTQRYFRRLIRGALDEYLPHLIDILPYDIRSRNNLLNLAQSLINIHFPEELPAQKKAYERLSFEEFFLFQLPLILRKLKAKERKGISHQTKGELVDRFISNLPFQLTSAQQKVILEIGADMAGPQPMQRLLQGDVGSGKTVVAMIAAGMAVQGGYQAAFLVPTEVLANQHYEKIKSQAKKIKIGLFTGSLGKREREKVCQEIKEGKSDLIIGTHALLEEGIHFKNLGLVVIDEQHKFGVGQRALLPKKGRDPDVLIMTATPIPRTLAITLYGDLDVSVIDELPPGRIPVKTLHLLQGERPKGYALAREELHKGRQVFVIYPVIEESYALDISGAKKMHAALKAHEFKGFNVGLIHGQLKQKEQDEVMRRFKDKELDVLVSTSLMEVGIDIPNASCMIIEHAERFGLSQLHQLRGRVGRSVFESSCLLVSDAQTEDSKRRIEAMVRFSDGFRIAEQDLKIRGPGEFFGSRQSGLTELKIGNPLAQMQLLKRAREEAVRLLKADPRLEERTSQGLKKKLLQRFPEYEKLMLVG